MSPYRSRAAGRTRPLRCLLTCVLLALAAFTPAARAGGPEPFVQPSGLTHWYEVIAVPQGLTWVEAKQAAAARGGHLATITSKEENEFVFGLLDDAQYWQEDPTRKLANGPWIGGVQDQQSVEPSGGWGWVELETWTAEFWAAGEPNDDRKADRLHYAAGPQSRAATWGDAAADARLPGYVVEYSGPFTPRTIGLIQRQPESFEGYTLFAPLLSQWTFLVDANGRYVHSWYSRYLPGSVTYLLPDGKLLRAGVTPNQNFPLGGGGAIELLEWDGTPTWTFEYSTSKYVTHHDVIPLPGGTFLCLVWEEKTAAECIAAGRDPKQLPDDRLVIDRLIEVRPTGPTSGQIVWEWTMWDHLIQDFDAKKPNFGDPKADPHKIDINYITVGGGDDITHSNALAYNEQLDQIAISVRHFNEIWVIDHSTTTAEARTSQGGRSGRGGNLLYRWGNPAAYRAGTAKDQKLFFQHDCTWQPGPTPGTWNMLVFNNGNDRPEGDISSADEWTLPTPDKNGNYPRTGDAWGPKDLAWSFTTPTPTDMFSPAISGAQRLPNGNTLICSGIQAWTLEVTPQKRIVWEYKVPLGMGVNWPQGTDNVPVPWNFRSYRYAPDFPGLVGKNLKGTEPLETYRSVLLADGSTAPHHAPYGSTVEFVLRTPKKNAGLFYVLGTSMTDALMPIDHRYFRAGYDVWLETSILGSWPVVFENYLGVLNSAGRAKAPFHVPNARWLRGHKFYTCGVVFDPAARTGISLLTNQIELTVTDK